MTLPLPDPLHVIHIIREVASREIGEKSATGS